jgi:MFS family permease
VQAAPAGSRALGPLAGFVALGLFWGATAALLPQLQTRTHATKVELGIALLGVAVGALPTMAATGVAIDRLGRPLIAPACVLFAAATVGPAFAHSPWQLALAMVGVGIGSGGLDVAMNTAVSALEAESGRRLMQLAHALYSAGVVVGSVTVGLLRAIGAPPLALLAATAAVLLGTGALNRGQVPGRVRGGGGFRLRPTRTLLVLGALGVVVFVVEGGTESWSALFLERELDSTPAVSGLGPGLFAAAMVAGRTLGQGLEARLGERRLLAGGAVVTGAGLALAAVAPSSPVALLGFVVAGAGIAVGAPTLFGAAGRSADDAGRGSAVATVTTLGYLGFLVGPPLMGGVSGGLGLRAGFAMLALLAALLAVAAASALRR